MRRSATKNAEDPELTQPLKFSIGSDEEEDDPHTIPAAVHLSGPALPSRRYVVVARWLLYLFPRLLLLVLVALLITALLPGGWRVALCSASVLPPPPLREGENITMIGHRGSEFPYPENTLQALKEGGGLLGFVEMDIALTSDGEVVIMHDSTLDRTTNGTGVTCEQPLSYIRGLRATLPETDPVGRRVHAKLCEVTSASGQVRPCTYRVPTLGEVFDTLPDGTRYMLDAKQCYTPGVVATSQECSNCTRLMERTKLVMEKNFIKPEHVIVTSTEVAVLKFFETGMPKGVSYSLSMDAKYANYKIEPFLNVLNQGNWSSAAMYVGLVALRPDLVRAVQQSRPEGASRTRDVFAWTIRRHLEFRAARCAGATNFIVAQPSKKEQLISWLDGLVREDP